MFTGLIQSVGKARLSSKGVIIEGCESFAPLSVGDSVAVDGVCLTVADFTEKGFWADVSEETLSRTTLGVKASKHSPVNLEPALRISDRLGGHLVSGHIDGLGEVLRIQKLKFSWELVVRWQKKDWSRYVCEKGSIAVDGISLTVADSKKGGLVFSIAVIPHTWDNTSLKFLNIGDLVNLEADLLAKYTEKLLFSKQSKSEQQKIEEATEVNQEWLSSHGWN
tara:strand:- start:732 stop:1397 length:666 start_codon:yes stop_codon:yes gene_type:complete